MTSQAQILNKILKTKDFSLVSMNNITEDYFFDYKAEFNYIKNHFEKYHIVPDELSFASVFPDFDLFEVNEPNSYLLEELFKDYNTAYLATRFNNIKKMLENEKTDDAIQYFLASSENLRKGSAMTSTNLLEDTSRYDRFVERLDNHDKYYISTGFPELDDLIGGIDRENENMVIAARTGIGKSWTLIKIAVAASLQKLRVGIYSGEMSVDKVGYRVDTLLGHIENSAITRGYDYGSSHPVQRNYKNYIDGLSSRDLGPIIVVTPSDIAGPATVDALNAFIDKDKLDILLIDQYSLLEDTSHAKASFERVANISKAIKNLQVLKKIPIISVSQMNRTKNEDGSQDTTQIGLSDRIGQDATCIIMLDRKETPMQDGSDKKINQLVINIVKSRDGGDGKKLTYAADFNNGTFTYVNENPTEQEAQSTRDSYESSDDSSTVF